MFAYHVGSFFHVLKYAMLKKKKKKKKKKKLCQGCSKKCGGQCCPILQQPDWGRAQTTNGVQERVLRLPNQVQQFNRGQGRRVHGGSV